MAQAETLTKFADAMANPYMFPTVKPTDKDCSVFFNMAEQNYSSFALIQTISNVVNMDMGDPLAWFFPWKFAMYVLVFGNYLFSWSGLNGGRISMWTNGYVKNYENDMAMLIPCVTQNVEKGAWSEWGAQMVFYTSSLKGITALYEAANALPYGIASTIPITGYFGGNIAGMLKLCADIAGLLVWSNMILIETPLAPVTWAFPTYTEGAAAAATS